MSETVRFSVNGEPREIEVRAEESAAEVLRDRLGLTGAKLVCGEGVCGACTVLLDGVPVTSCLLPATALEGRALTTVEGLGPDLHPVQRAFIAHDALQCGYCTPGFVVEAIAFHDRWRRERGSDEPAREDVARGAGRTPVPLRRLRGNPRRRSRRLCRPLRRGRLERAPPGGAGEGDRRGGVCRRRAPRGPARGRRSCARLIRTRA